MEFVNPATATPRRAPPAAMHTAGTPPQTAVHVNPGGSTHASNMCTTWAQGPSIVALCTALQPAMQTIRGALGALSSPAVQSLRCSGSPAPAKTCPHPPPSLSSSGSTAMGHRLDWLSLRHAGAVRAEVIARRGSAGPCPPSHPTSSPRHPPTPLCVCSQRKSRSSHTLYSEELAHRLRGRPAFTVCMRPVPHNRSLTRAGSMGASESDGRVQWDAPLEGRGGD